MSGRYKDDLDCTSSSTLFYAKYLCCLAQDEELVLVDGQRGSVVLHFLQVHRQIAGYRTVYIFHILYSVLRIGIRVPVPF